MNSPSADAPVALAARTAADPALTRTWAGAPAGLFGALAFLAWCPLLEDLPFALALPPSRALIPCNGSSDFALAPFAGGGGAGEASDFGVDTGAAAGSAATAGALGGGPCGASITVGGLGTGNDFAGPASTGGTPGLAAGAATGLGSGGLSAFAFGSVGSASGSSAGAADAAAAAGGGPNSTPRASGHPGSLGFGIGGGRYCPASVSSNVSPDAATGAPEGTGATSSRTWELAFGVGSGGGPGGGVMTGGATGW